MERFTARDARRLSNGALTLAIEVSGWMPTVFAQTYSWARSSRCSGTSLGASMDGASILFIVMTDVHAH